MPAYVILGTFTDQGIRTVKDSPKRAKTADEAAPSGLGRFIGTWWTQGPYDLVSIVEAPDDETAARLGLVIGMQGNVRSLTMRAISSSLKARMVSERTLP